MSTFRLTHRSTSVFFLTAILLFGVVCVASAGSTTRELGTNFTLVNLNNGSNQVTINYYKPDGSLWYPQEIVNLYSLGQQIIRTQYSAQNFSAGKGSVTVDATGPVGTLVQIQARYGQISSNGAYIPPSDGAPTVYVPLVARNLMSASGNTNSQIIVQNTTGSGITFSIRLINQDGSTRYTTNKLSLAAGASYEYDLDNENRNNVPTNWSGSALVLVNNSGKAAVISNIFSGYNSLQTFTGFTRVSSRWVAPLFASKLTNGLSTPITVQNVSGRQIPLNKIKLSCVNSSGQVLTIYNATAVNNYGFYAFNPLNDPNNLWPANWYGACTIVAADSATSTNYDTVAFVQMRYVNPPDTASTDEAAAYEAIDGNSTTTKVVVPLYAKRLGNGFATVTTIQNLSPSAPANITLEYKAGAGAAANCTQTLTAQIPPGQNNIQNLRITSGAGSVPQLADTCTGSLVVTSSGQPIGVMVQLTNTSTSRNGDTLMAQLGIPLN